MPKHPVKVSRRAVTDAKRHSIEVIEPRSGRHAFASFRYSRVEFTAHGGKAQLRARNTRFEDGRLTSESFEGELEGSAYDQLVKQTQQYVAHQTEQFLRAFSLFLPFSTKRPSGRD